MHPTARYPILIIGAGPVGLSLALGLLRRGLAVLVFERRPVLAADPRATTLQPPTLEMLRELGVLQQVLSRSRRVDTLEYWDWGKKRRRLACLDLASLASQTSAPYRLHCSQPDLCRVLYDAVESLQPGTVRLGATLTSFVDRGSCVDVDISQGGKTFTARGSWLCGADGAKSKVRGALEIPMRKVGKPDTFFTCEVDLGSAPTLGDAAYLFTPMGWALWMRMPGSVRLLMLLDDPSRGMSDTELEHVRRALFRDQPGQRLRNRAMYRVQAQVAETWRKGRSIILGDAAHMTFPVNGTAMNSGVHDGYTLSQVLQSDGDLDQWAGQRIREITHRVNANASATYKVLAANGIFSTFTRNRYLKSLSKPEVATQHLLRCSMLEGRALAPPELVDDEGR